MLLCSGYGVLFLFPLLVFYVSSVKNLKIGNNNLTFYQKKKVLVNI